MNTAQRTVQIWIDVLPYIIVITLGFIFWATRKKD